MGDYKTHNKRAKWLDDENKRVDKIPMMNYNTITVKTAINSTANWKAPVTEGIHNFWLKKFYDTHNSLAKLLIGFLHNSGTIPTFIVTFFQKPASERDPAKYRPITCLPTVYKY